MEGFPSPTLGAAHLTLWTTVMCSDQPCFADEEVKHSKVRKPDHVGKTIPTAQEWAEFLLALEPSILHHCVNCCLSMQQAEQKSFWFSLQMRSFSNFPKMREPKRMMIFFSFRLRSRFVRRLTKQSSSWLLARVSVVVFLRAVTDPSWGLADLILHLTSELETRASTAVQTGERYSLIGNVSPSQS